MWLWICTFIRNFMPLSLSVFELCWLNKKKKKMNKLPIVEPPRTRLKELYIPCYFCKDVFTTVASPCQTLRELLAWIPRVKTPAHQLVVPCVRRSPRVCTSVLFISPVTMQIEKVRYGRTSLNSCDKTLHTLLSL